LISNEAKRRIREIQETSNTEDEVLEKIRYLESRRVSMKLKDPTSQVQR
jgi:hypothetical protein